MTVEPTDTTPRAVRDGVTYYFCSEHCRTRFEKGSPEPDATGQWTCPMHPEIIQDAPGSCPKCGMALEPRAVSLHAERNPELIDFTRRLVVAGALSIPLLALAMGDALFMRWLSPWAVAL